ncbi:MAG: hypothetical protein NTZ83_05215 [Candidatus Pacearchaeota archaeon]|nr:hypothetical protein [Candidatus Pacearchaeota archaeon]
MKKLLVFLVMFGVLMLGVGGVMADTQTLEGNVEGTTSFTLLNPILSFGSIPSGSNSVLINNTIRVNSINNVAFHLGITLTSDPTLLFSNIYLDLDESGIPEAQLNTALDMIMNDPPGETVENHNLWAQLKVPAGFAPVTGATGTITYLVTGPVV